MIPDWCFYPNKDRGVSHSDCVIRLINNVEIFLASMDRPERIEGPPLSGIVLDEFGNMKKDTWGAHVRPALSDTNGWAAFIGVPEGMNHYQELVEKAEQHIIARKAENLPPHWSIHHWHSKIVLSKDELDASLQEMDPDTFDQEYGGEFVYFRGRIYYVFDKKIHASQRLRPLYNPQKDLDFSLDFNVAPGVAAVSQEMILPGQFKKTETLPGRFEDIPITGTAVIGEVWIPKNSNTPLVCNRLYTDWKDHQGLIHVWGDATGGHRGSAQVDGSDWDLVKRELNRLFGTQKMRYHIKRENPSEKARVNAMNSRLMTASGIVRMMVDPVSASHVVKDFEGVRRVEGGSGEIEKLPGTELTHITDGLGYQIEFRYPIYPKTTTSQHFIM